VERVGLRRRKSAVYRLLDCGDGRSVIAKWSIGESFAIERLVYEQVLPLLPITKPIYFGALEEEDFSGWLFLEDTTGSPFDGRSEVHHGLVGRWLGDLHTSGSLLPALQTLPDRGLRYSHDNLMKAAELIEDNIQNRYLNEGNVGTLNTLLSHLNSIDTHWSRLEVLCGQSPTVFVHGDFKGKNLCFRPRGAAYSLTTLDWEFAGRGLPAVDLAILAKDDSRTSSHAYWIAARRSWPDLTQEQLAYWIQLGTLFRLLAAAHWASTKLPYEWIQDPMDTLEVIEPMLGAFTDSSWWTN
jgi:aminoglycoside phosphotransferase (APT) family kinase protein